MSTYNIQPNSVSPGGEEQSMSYQEIMRILHGLKPGDVASAGAAFENLGKVLDGVAEKLRNTAMKLAADNSWRGAAAQAAMTKFQQLHDQAAQLAANAHTTANSVNWIGHDVLPKYKAIPNPQVMGSSESDAVVGGATFGAAGAASGYALGAMGIGPDGQAKADKAAREYMSTLNGHLASAPFPQTIQGPGTEPSIGTGQWITPGSGGGGGSRAGGSAPGYGGVGGSGGSGAGAPIAGYTPPADAGQFNPAKLPSGGTGSAGSLQGYSPPGGGAGSPFGAGSPGTITTGGGSANPFSRMGMMPGEEGLGRGGLPGEEGIPGESGLGKGGLPGEEGLPGESGLADGAASDVGSAATDGAAGEAAGADAAGAAGAEGAEGMGMNGMPMAGSGSGQQDKERQRQAWMHEDDEIWGVPEHDVGPVIG